MRAFRTRHRYRCAACKSVMLLKDAEKRESHWAFLVVALAAALGGVYVAIGYWENWADAQERRVLSREWEQ